MIPMRTAARLLRMGYSTFREKRKRGDFDGYISFYDNGYRVRYVLPLFL